MEEVIIASAVRTPVGSFGGSLKDVGAVDLGALVISEALKRSKVDPRQVDEVIMGNVLQAGLGQNPARQAAVKAGLPYEVSAYTVNKVCGSGLKTVALAAQAVAAGEAEIVVAGGMENMSAAPYLLPGSRWGYRMNDARAIDSMLTDGLTCAFNQVHMGITAENVAEKYGISREAQDNLALTSQERALAAIDAGRFKEEIVPVSITAKKEKLEFAVDEFPRRGTSLEKLAGLKPAFKPGGTVTAGNASGINDGAAAVVVMKAAKAAALGLKPLVRIISSASAGVDPALMGTGPIPASRKALAKAGLNVADLDLIEANEAFAAQAEAVIRELELDRLKTNVNGGAIALGHPIGASGARILVTLIHELIRRQGRLGLATLCIGGGQGMAMVVERVS